MARCLYCQQDNPSDCNDCQDCGMPLPALQEQAREKRVRRFVAFCIGLTIFCFVMFFWLPRSIS
ncbi:MAG TPA: protein DnrP [Pseudomonas sp.]|jgi:hypothetical protein|nr:protein DnrP [Pseudomonas sp.]